MIPVKDTIPSSTFPFINYFLITLNCTVFFYEVNLDQEQVFRLIHTWGVIPSTFLSLDGNPLTLATSMFLHGGWLHFIGNMLYLYIFGDNVENRLGHSRYLLFYMCCGFLASICQIFSEPSSNIPMIGASGAIAGVMGAYFVLFPHSRIVTVIFIIFIIKIVEVPAFFFLAFWFMLQFLSGAVTVSAEGGGVAWWAHIGGFMGGILLLLLLKNRKKQ